jgi:ketosteroid isomerase-like protein
MFSSREPMTATPDEIAVAAANLAFYRALESREIEAMELVWLRDESASCVHPGWHRLDGWSEIRRSWESIFANSRAWTVSCEDERISVVGDIACVRCVEVILPFGADGLESAARMQATNLFVRRNRHWQMVHHHASPSPGEPAPSAQPVN